MNRISIMIAAAAMLAACGCKTTDNGTDKTLTTDSVKYENKGKMAEVTITAEYPVGGGELLTNAIREYINESLGGTYTGKLTDGNSLATFYGNTEMKTLTDDAKEYWNENSVALVHEYVFHKEHETDKYVTYTAIDYSYMGGAHGLSVFSGTTFRKSDGRRFGMEMLHDTDKEGFRLLLKEGLKEYFSENASDTNIKTDEDLKNCLMTDNGVDYLPLPRTNPYLTEKGVAFVYQAYEIAPYAAGLPTFIIPYDKMEPYMTVTALRMLK